MVDATVRYGKDTWAGSGKPNANHNGANRLRLASGASYAYLYLKTPVPHGMTVVSAKLQVYAARTADWTGSKTLTVRRIGDSWKPGKLTWNNKPGVTGSTMPTVTVSGATDAQLLELDVTVHLQTVANGSNHYGWRIETDSTTAHRVYGFDSPYPPRLVVTYTDKPTAPTDLAPQGGSVSVAKPYLSFSATDLTKPGEITAVQVQIDPAASTTAPGFDSGEVATTVPELNLASTSYAGLAAGASTQWRVRVKAADGTWSDWSPWVTFSRTDKGTLTITNPGAAPNNYVTESTPPILATSSVALDSAEVLIVDQADHTKILAESGPFDMASGTSVSWTPPAGIIHDTGTYTAIVRATDTVDRIETAGDPEYVEAAQDFTFAQDTSVTAPGSLTAGQNGGAPGVVLSWVRATAPDSWTILRDGKNIAADVDPADTSLGGGNHSWTDDGAAPGVQHAYEVRAVVNGKASGKSNTATITPRVDGIWIIDGGRGLKFIIGGNDVGSWAYTDQVGVYEVVGSDTLVQIHSGLRGISGSSSGPMRDRPHMNLTLDQLEADLWSIKEQPDRTVRLVAGSMSIPVKLRNLSCTLHPDHSSSAPRKHVSFEFFQVGGLPFDVRL